MSHVSHSRGAIARTASPLTSTICVRRPRIRPGVEPEGSILRLVVICGRWKAFGGKVVIEFGDLVTVSLTESQLAQCQQLRKARAKQAPPDGSAQRTRRMAFHSGLLEPSGIEQS